MIRLRPLIRALALVAAYLLAVEGVVASAAAAAHAGRMASVDEGTAVWCGSDPGSTGPGAPGACDDLCRLAIAAAPPAAPSAVRTPAARSIDASEQGRTTAAFGAPRRSSLARGPPASARRA